MDGEEDNVVTTFINLFNAVHAFTINQTEIISMMRTYHNKNKNIQSSFYLEATTRKILSKREKCFLSLENLYLLP